MTAAIILVVVAAGLLIVEVTFPTFGLAAVLAASAYAMALYLAFTESATSGTGIIVAGVVAFPLAFGLALHLMKTAPFARRNILEAPKAESIERGVSEERRKLMGATGIAATELRPLGRADIGGSRLEVIASGTWIESGAAVRVVEVEAHRIVVDRIPTPES